MKQAQHQQFARHSMWDTPQGRARLNGIHAALLDSLRSPDTAPSMAAQAWSQYRTERFTELGLERMTGSAAVYHLITDFGGNLHDLSRTIACPHTSDKDKAKGIARVASRTIGYRWHAGVEGLLHALSESGAPEEHRVTCFAERRAFENRFFHLVDAVGTLLKERLLAPAVAAARGVVDALVGEGECLVEWLEIAGLYPDAAALRTHVDGARATLLKRIGDGRRI